MIQDGRQITLIASVLVVGLGLSVPGWGQTALPASAPTAITPSQLPSANPSFTHTAPGIHWDGHLLQITASGQMLSQIFSEVATRTGLRISGNPPAEPLYGSYGPAPLFDVLAQLVDGLPVNMLFVGKVGTKPAQLTFSARNGAAPVTTASSSAAQTPAPQQQTPDQTYSNADLTGTSNPAATTNPVVASPGLAPTAAQSGDTSTNPASPNGVKTPQEIFEQLQRLRGVAGAQR